MQITDLVNPYNTWKARLEVEVYSTELRDFVVISDEGNPGMSITNAAEFYCPQITEQLELDWKRCVFIESYPENESSREFDPTFDLIMFQNGLLERSYPLRRKPLKVAILCNKGWSPIPRPLAEALQTVGLQMSRNIGKTGIFKHWDTDKQFEALITGYDGRRYYKDDSDDYLKASLKRIVEPE